jgi:hypothetical protein
LVETRERQSPDWRSRATSYGIQAATSTRVCWRIRLTSILVFDLIISQDLKSDLKSESPTSAAIFASV